MENILRVRCCHCEDPNFKNIITKTVIAQNNWFYIDGELEKWCQEKFGGVADKCEIIEANRLPNTINSRGDLEVMLNGPYSVNLMGCPFKCIGYFYTTKEMVHYIGEKETIETNQLRGYIVKRGDIIAEKKAMKNMLFKNKHI